MKRLVYDRATPATGLLNGKSAEIRAALIGPTADSIKDTADTVVIAISADKRKIVTLVKADKDVSGVIRVLLSPAANTAAIVEGVENSMSSTRGVFDSSHARPVDFTMTLVDSHEGTSPVLWFKSYDQ